MIEAKPFLKWVGGKKSILPELVKRVPKDIEVYFEPFLGGGALFFELQPKKALLSDLNPILINTYIGVRDYLPEVFQHLKTHKQNHTDEYYFKQRELLKADPSKISEQAARFIYLNKTCFNGLFRVNKSGLFNVPMGDYKNPSIFDPETLEAASKALQGKYIVNRNYKDIQGKGFVYLDPPYHNAFEKYTAKDFKEEQHRELADYCRDLTKRGSLFMLSNSDTPLIRELYKDFNIEEVYSRRSVSCKAEQREQVKELIIRNYGS